MKRIIEGSIVAGLLALVLLGCNNRVNQTGSWLVAYDSTLVPQYLDSVLDSLKTTSSQVNNGLATGSSEILSLGMVPWTEADLLMRFSAFNPVYGAESILSATIIMTRGPYTLDPSGNNAMKLMFNGYSMDSSWNYTTVTWDSIAAMSHGASNIVSSQTITDSTVMIGLDTSVVRLWANATQDTAIKNNGFVIKPTSVNGVLSVYSQLASISTSAPVCRVVYMLNGVMDTSNIALDYSTSVAHTTLAAVAPPGPYKIVQSGTGLRENLIFDLGKIPNYSIVNSALLTLHFDSTAEAPYSYTGIIDTLIAYYLSDPSTNQISTRGSAVALVSNNEYTFDVTTIVQHMLNNKNYGFLIAEYNELENVDSRFLYDGSAPDSLKPRLIVTYTPAVKK
ncbi:MAG: DNRLRE domain-containing protein [Bacteroidetes bacterium]|nr:DNRLRE domain-containing protein [Bacteroidota bacterium]